MDDITDPTLKILLVEDEKFHQTMARKYLDKGNIPYTLTLVQDGEQALDFLYRRGEYSNAHRPDLILLDLGIPKVAGDEVFKQLKKDSNLSQIPVIVLSGADPDLANDKFPDIPLNCRFTKWMDMKDFTSLIKTVRDYKTKFSKLGRRPSFLRQLSIPQRKRKFYPSPYLNPFSFADFGRQRNEVRSVSFRKK